MKSLLRRRATLPLADTKPLPYLVGALGRDLGCVRPGPTLFRCMATTGGPAKDTAATASYVVRELQVARSSPSLSLSCNALPLLRGSCHSHHRSITCCSLLSFISRHQTINAKLYERTKTTGSTQAWRLRAYSKSQMRNRVLSRLA